MTPLPYRRWGTSHVQGAHNARRGGRKRGPRNDPHARQRRRRIKRKRNRQRMLERRRAMREQPQALCECVRVHDASACADAYERMFRRACARLRASVCAQV